MPGERSAVPQAHPVTRRAPRASRTGFVSLKMRRFEAKPTIGEKEGKNMPRNTGKTIEVSHASLYGDTTRKPQITVKVQDDIPDKSAHQGLTCATIYLTLGMAECKRLRNLLHEHIVRAEREYDEVQDTQYTLIRSRKES